MENIEFIILIAAVTPFVFYAIGKIFDRNPTLAQRLAWKDKNRKLYYWKIPGSVATYLMFVLPFQTYCSSNIPHSPRKDALERINEIKITLKDVGINKDQLISELKKDLLGKRVGVPMHKRKRFVIITDEYCKRIDKKYMDEILKLNVCYENEKHSALVQQIIGKMQKVMPGKFSGKYLLLDSDKVNAFCFPYGSIAVTKGLMESTTVDQLAFVIGHEYGHFLARHSAEGLTKAIIQENMDKYIAKLVQDEEDDWKITTTIKGIIKLGYHGGAIFGVQLPNSRKCEREADRLGVYLAKSAGYDMHKGITLLEQWARTEKSRDAFDYLLSTHPSSRSRFELTREVLTGLEKEDGKTLPLWGSPMDDTREKSKVAAINTYLKIRKPPVEDAKKKFNEGKEVFQKKKNQWKDMWKKKFPPKPQQKQEEHVLPRAA